MGLHTAVLFDWKILTQRTVSSKSYLLHCVMNRIDLLMKFSILELKFSFWEWASERNLFLKFLNSSERSEHKFDWTWTIPSFNYLILAISLLFKREYILQFLANSPSQNRIRKPQIMSLWGWAFSSTYPEIWPLISTTFLLNHLLLFSTYTDSHPKRIISDGAMSLSSLQRSWICKHRNRIIIQCYCTFA